MDEQLSLFVEKYEARKSEPFTHTSKEPKRNYYISEESTKNFFTAVCNSVSKKKPSCITEKPGLYGPLRVDFDLKAKIEHGFKRQYTPGMIKQIVCFYQEEIKKIIQEEVFDKKMLICIVLEKSKPRQDENAKTGEKKIKDGFHLHFPFFICEGWIQDIYLGSNVTKKMIESKIWENTDFIEPVEKFIDREKMAKKTWMMYGSAKSLDAEPFLVTKAYNDLTIDPTSEGISLNEVFKEKMIGRKNSVNYYLPRFLSIQGYEQSIPLKPAVEQEKEILLPKRKKKDIVLCDRKQEDILKDFNIIRDGEIMEMLCNDRAEHYDTWMDVGWTLYCIGEGTDEFYQLWLDFSKKSSLFEDESYVEDKWAKMEVKNKTIGSLLAMAKKDSPDKYESWKKSTIDYAMNNSFRSLKPSEGDVSEVFIKMYGDRFRCADYKKGIWFEFTGQRWKESDGGVTLHKLIKTELRNTYYEYAHKLNGDWTKYKTKEVELKQMEVALKQMDKDLSDEEKEEMKKLVKKKDELGTRRAKCYAIAEELGRVTFQGKLSKSISQDLYDSNFMKKIDENTMIFGCDNGVLDLNLGIFRDGSPDDYITFSCGKIFNKNIKTTDPEIIELYDFFRKVFPNENRRKYFFDIMSSCLEGGNLNKTFVFHTGNGNNAKSATFTLVEETFGEYFIKFPRELFIIGKGNSSGSARPELARVRGRRIGVAQELSKIEHINIGVVKEMTGNDSFFTRGMYEKGTEIKPQFTLMAPCNDPPKIPGHDEATFDRLKILLYESKFVKPDQLEKYPVSQDKNKQFEEKRFLADLSFSKKLKGLAPYFLWMLFENYKEYKKSGGLQEPPEVKIPTELYRDKNDVYRQFITDKIKPMPITPKMKVNDKPFLSLSELHSDFINWYREVHESYTKDKFTQNTLLHEFNRRFNEEAVKQEKEVIIKGKKVLKVTRTRGWYGYVLVKDDDDGEKSNDLRNKIIQKAEKSKV